MAEQKLQRLRATASALRDANPARQPASSIDTLITLEAGRNHILSFHDPVTAIVTHVSGLPGMDRLRSLMPDMDLDETTIGEIVRAAGEFADRVLRPFDQVADKHGCRLEHGRVRTAPGHATAWRSFADAGWTTLEAPAAFGGTGLPLVVYSACEELFNRGSPAFGMLATSTRCAVRLLQRFAGDDIKQEWLSRLVAGDWSATICVSEPGAGSDLARVGTTARIQVDGGWRINGEKSWVSFGDHDLTERIGHMLLARTPDAPTGSTGLSLFLVPSNINGHSNGVHTRRVETKLGLHGSPTCALGFEDARGYLIGAINKGLPQLFTMITGMRISVASQGAAIASAAADLALSYASERRQGGPADRCPVPIESHADVQRMLLGMTSRAEMARGLVLMTSLTADLAEREPDAAAREEAAALLGWLLPITKNFGAEAGFIVANESIQVLGGAGYTRDWPVEQSLRDARVLSIYEGTSGMQALDLVQRRLLRDGAAGLWAFVRAARSDIERAQDAASAARLEQVLDELISTSRALSASHTSPHASEIAVYPYLQLASLAATGWIALRLTNLSGDRIRERLAARGRHWLRLLPSSAMHEVARIALGPTSLQDFPLAR